jgi:hypothetical protein
MSIQRALELHDVKALIWKAEHDGFVFFSPFLGRIGQGEKLRVRSPQFVPGRWMTISVKYSVRV